MARKLLHFAFLAALAVSVFPIASFATNQQVNSNTYRQLTNAPLYGRSDGIYMHKDSKTLRLIGNGDGFTPIGATYYIDFTGYTDGQGCFAESVFAPGDAGFVTANGANTACDTTCGNAACVYGTDGTDAASCTDATADGCLCMNAGLDLYGLCGAAWESPALGKDLLRFGDGSALVSGALLAQDIGVDMDADGLDIGGDQTDDDGFEIFGGMYGASGRPMFPGIDPAFKFCATVKIEDLSGTDEFWVGWRDITPLNATFNGYNSYAVIGVDNGTGDIHTETEDDGGGTTTTDITVSAWTEGQNGEFCVLVSDAGAVTYTFEGETATDAVAYTLDNGEPVIPFIHFLNSSDLADEIIIVDWTVSYQ